MRSVFAALLIAGALALMPAAAGAQSNFPEQPGDNVATGCANVDVTQNDGTLLAFGVAEADDGLAPTATENRITDTFIDACAP
jgi:hypothetical protein